MNVQYPASLRAPQAGAVILRQFYAAESPDREMLILLTLDTKNKIIGLNVVSVGALSVSVAHPREMMKLAVLQNAAAVIIGHNHPSGDPDPSREDIDTYKRLQQAGEVMGIRVLDSIIIGENTYYSMQSESQGTFEE